MKNAGELIQSAELRQISRAVIPLIEKKPYADMLSDDKECDADEFLPVFLDEINRLTQKVAPKRNERQSEPES